MRSIHALLVPVRRRAAAVLLLGVASCVATGPALCGSGISFVWQVSDPGAPYGPLAYPNGVEVSADGSLVYVSDSGKARVVVLTSSGAGVLQFGSYGTGPGQFRLPCDVAVDAAGNIFVADTMNHRVQKFSPAGAFLLQIGSFGSGAGQLNAPHGIVVNRATNTLYVVDTMNHRVARFSTVTGAHLGNWGSRGTGSGQYRYPHDAALDLAGNLYVTDFVNHRVQKLSDTGTVLAIWGSRGHPCAPGDLPGQFQHPWGIAGGANIYVSDMSNHRIQAFTTGGTFLGTYGSYAAGGAGGPGLDHPKGMTVYSPGGGVDRLYLAQPGAQAVNAYDVSEGAFAALGAGGPVAAAKGSADQLDADARPPADEVESAAASVHFLWGVNTVGGPSGALAHPNGVEVGPGGTLVHAADSGNARVVVFSSAGTPVLQFGSRGTGAGQFDLPSDVAVDAAGNIFVADTMNHRVQKFTSAGAFVFQVGGFGTGAGQLNAPHGIAINRASNVLYVVDTLNHRVERFSSQTGTHLGSWGGFGTAPGQFRFPHDAAVDQDGNVYVTDFVNHRIQKLSSAGAVLAVWGGHGCTEGLFEHPWGIAAGQNIYVSDMGNHRIQEFRPDGTFVKKYGAYAIGGTNGLGLDHPKGIAVFSEVGDDKLYLAHPGADAIYAFEVLLGTSSQVPALPVLGVVLLAILLLLAGLKYLRPARPAGPTFS